MCLQFYRTGFPNLWATDWYDLWDQQRYKLRNEVHSMQYAWIILKPSPFPGPCKDDFHKTGPWCQRCWGPLMLSGFSHILHKGCDTAFVKLRQWFLFSLLTLWTCTNTRIQSFCLCIKHFIRKRFIKSAESRSLPSRKLYYQFSSVTQSSLTLCDPMDCSPPGSSVHGDSPGKSTGVGCHVFLQGIFPTQGSNPGLPHCRWILHQESPNVQLLFWVRIKPKDCCCGKKVFAIY